VAAQGADTRLSHDRQVSPGQRRCPEGGEPGLRDGAPGARSARRRAGGNRWRVFPRRCPQGEHHHAQAAGRAVGGSRARGRGLWRGTGCERRRRGGGCAGGRAGGRERREQADGAAGQARGGASRSGATGGERRDAALADRCGRSAVVEDGTERGRLQRADRGGRQAQADRRQRCGQRRQRHRPASCRWRWRRSRRSMPRR
jgi:hypothetical protein